MGGKKVQPGADASSTYAYAEGALKCTRELDPNTEQDVDGSKVTITLQTKYSWVQTCNFQPKQL